MLKIILSILILLLLSSPAGAINTEVTISGNGSTETESVAIVPDNDSTELSGPTEEKPPGEDSKVTTEIKTEPVLEQPVVKGIKSTPEIENVLVTESPELPPNAETETISPPVTNEETVEAEDQGGGVSLQEETEVYYGNQCTLYSPLLFISYSYQ